MDAKVEDRADAGASKRSNAISLSAPDADAPPRAKSVAPQDPDPTPDDARSYKVTIPRLGESFIFGTSLNGPTLFHMQNLGDGEAEVHLTWLGERQSKVARIFTNRRGGTEFYRDEFGGARVSVVNLSETSDVQIRVILCP